MNAVIALLTVSVSLVYASGMFLTSLAMCRLLLLFPEKYLDIPKVSLILRLWLLDVVWPWTMWRLYGAQWWQTRRGES